MQKTINNILAEINRVIMRPPSRPIRLMFFETTMLYGFAQNKVKDEFETNEIININDFFESDEFGSVEDKLSELESNYGNNNHKFQRKLCQALEKYIISFIEKNESKKILIIEDSELYNNGFDPIHFLSAYMYEHYLIIEKEIPVIWMTVGQKEEYESNKYRYYKTDTTTGRTIKLSQDGFSSCIFDYKSNY